MINYQEFEETFKRVQQEFDVLMKKQNKNFLNNNALVDGIAVALGRINKNILPETKDEKEYKKFVAKYKQLVVPEFVKLLNPNVIYSPEKGILKRAYEDGQFEGFEYYNSEDYISGYINDYKFEMANVCTKKSNVTQEGKREFVVDFQGLYAIMPLPETKGIELYLRNDYKDTYKALSQLITEDFDSLYSKMDSSEFEKSFDVYTNNKDFASKIFTQDIMKLMVEYKKQINIPFEFTIKNNHFYIRFKGYDLFEPYVLDGHPILEKNQLYKDYYTLNFAYTIMLMMYDNINKNK